ncbi:hypothetical protein HYH02_005320 [Chlamydomonas schloesseri]|uniref:Alpha-type protein kinase domain-containing protein n=1 Tax=Chlamydomonas schloesseri TaxID=2026947 RepID=A0A836B7A7_9CHLO|nr:hypothetical protein HYH02_005320 [Chlamydomonas schloesseri]|eukprot:KAG2449797.1 hypothetical protein HYH02_005320 [Chlamydomonas schloesseri]
MAELYAKIAQDHGLPVAMQALGRLMISAPVVAAPAAAATPACTPASATEPTPAITTPAAAGSAVRPHGATSPFSATAAGAPGAAAAPAAPAATPKPIAIPGKGGAQSDTSPPSGGAAQPSPSPSPAGGANGLAHARTLESVHTQPSATLSQMPSGIMSLVSPSAAASVADADEESSPSQKISSSDLDAVVAAAAAAVTAAALPTAAAGAAAAAAPGAPKAANGAAPAAAPAAGGAAKGLAARLASATATAAAAAGSGGGGAPMDVPRAAAAAVAAAAKAEAVAAKAEAGPEGEEPESPKSNISGSVRTGFGTPRSGSLWQRAVNLSKAAADPWSGRNLHTLPMERAVRQRYNAMNGQWVTDEVLVKMEGKPFAAGAMRECYAAKKLSTFTHNVDWHKAQNMVAKRYKKEGVRKSVYYNDVLVQMDAKMLGECYNRTDPPKQVDVMQCAILQFPGRPGGPLYAVEQLIEGDYVKYNSNSGFVKGDDVLRNTPQAFSHFTWVLTRGMKICVDIQGVGDLYTDPQLHTLDGEGYGEGNLGLRGMALFFRSHECNALCCRLGLKPLDRCDADVRAQGYSSASASASASSSRARPAPATAARTMARTNSYRTCMAAAKKKRQQQPEAACAEEALLAALKDVPKETPESLVHLEIAKLYGEVVLLPELKPSEDPDDALRGGLFHLNAAAQGGCVLGLLVLARAHCGLDTTAPQFAQMFKVGSKQRLFQAHVRVAWRCTLLAAERGVRGAALAAASAYATGAGLFGEEVLDGQGEPAQAARWYAAALALPDLLAEAEADGGGDDNVIHEADEEEEQDEEDDGEGSERRSRKTESDDEPQFEMSVMRAASDRDSDAGMLPDLPLLPSAGSTVNLSSLRVPKIEELRPSKAFLHRCKLQAEEEASALPGASAARYEVLFSYGSLLLSGGEGLAADPAKAAELLEAAAEAASEAGKGKLAQRYYEQAAKAQAACEE